MTDPATDALGKNFGKAVGKAIGKELEKDAARAAAAPVINLSVKTAAESTVRSSLTNYGTKAAVVYGGYKLYTYEQKKEARAGLANKMGGDDKKADEFHEAYAALGGATSDCEKDYDKFVAACKTEAEKKDVEKWKTFAEKEIKEHKKTFLDNVTDFASGLTKRDNFGIGSIIGAVIGVVSMFVTPFLGVPLMIAGVLFGEKAFNALGGDKITLTNTGPATNTPGTLGKPAATTPAPTAAPGMLPGVTPPGATPSAPPSASPSGPTPGA